MCLSVSFFPSTDAYMDGALLMSRCLCALCFVQAGLGSIFISQSLLVDDSLLLEPRLSSASTLAAATAMQYFGLLLLPRGPEDDWLMRGLAGWLEGQGLKTVAGNNELQYKRWQVGWGYAGDDCQRRRHTHALAGRVENATSTHVQLACGA